MSEKRLKELLKICYGKIPDNRKGEIRCTNIDPAGNDYEFTEYEWSKEIRKLFGYEYEPTGI